VAGLSNLRQIGLALGMYAEVNQGYLPINNGANQNWAVYINKYAGGNSDEYNPGTNPLSKVFRDPSAAMDGGDLHYTCNPLVMPDITRNFGSGAKLLKSYKLTQVRPYPTEIALVFDGSQMKFRKGSCEPSAWQMDGGWMFGLPFGTAYRRNTDPGIDNPISITRPNIDDYSAGGAWPPGGEIRYRQMNNKACNLVFADGHAGTLRRGEVKRSNLRPFKP
jgi:prepilin-type processing-associated H-X9-DG protein